MVKKIIVGAFLVIVGVFAVPMAANAAYTPTTGTVTGSDLPGSTETVSFGDGTFQGGETVTFTVSGAGTPIVAVFRADTASGQVTATGAGAASDQVTLPTDATGTYSVTATGASSGQVATATITVASAASGSSSGGGGSSSGALPDTGSTVPMLLIWAATGALGLGVALVVVLTIVRRNRKMTNV